MAAEQPTGVTPADVIPVGAAIATWTVTWVVGMVLVGPVVFRAVGADADNYTIAELGLATVLGWSVFLAGLAYVSRRYAHPDIAPWNQFVAHFGLRFRPIDLVGIPLGVALQLAVVPLLYLPLRAIWPDTFSQSELEKRAQELADKAGGFNTVLLVLVVVIGAPVVEELVYRGLLQRSVSSKLGGAAGLVLVSLWFALVHPSPIEYPGLLVAGLAFGACLLVTGRLGASIATHFAFNAAGLVLALR